MNRRNLSVGLVVSALIAGFAADARAVTINTVYVGNAGNASDPGTGGAFGAVAYDYRIGQTEVTIGQYTAFLNAVAATDTYSLYNTNMATDPAIAGIARGGAPGSYSYNVIGSPNKPITYVSWGDAARFSNWLHNGQPTGPQNASTTENGAYPLNGATTDAALNAVVRSYIRWHSAKDLPQGATRSIENGIGGLLMALRSRYSAANALPDSSSPNEVHRASQYPSTTAHNRPRSARSHSRASFQKHG